MKPETRNQKRSVADALPPHSDEAEAGVLGCILLEPSRCLDELDELGVQTEWFYDLRHQLIFATARALHFRQPPVALDLITLQNELRQSGQLEQIGGLAYLTTLPDTVPSAVNLTSYTDIVREQWQLRVIAQACVGVLTRIDVHQGKVDELIDDLQTDISRLAELHTRRSELKIKEILQTKVIPKLEGHYTRGRAQMSGLVTTGLEYLDKIFCGLGGDNGNYHVFAARPNVGKAASLSTLVLTPSGFVAMREIKVGSLVVGRDGRGHPVIGVYPQGRKKVYRFIFSDGTSTMCCDEHLWFTQTRNERRGGCAGSVKDTAQIRQTVKRPDGLGWNHNIPLVKPVKFVSSGKRPLHPWLLGALIGDGALGNGGCQFTKPERDMQAKVRRLLPVGDTATHTRDKNQQTLSVKRKHLNYGRSETAKAIAALGLNVGTKQKFIPEVYLRAPIRERFDLLRGLLDTDGHVHTHGTSLEYSTSSKRLIQDFRFLVRSLGGICTTKPGRIPGYTYKGKKLRGAMNYRTMLWFEDQLVVPVSSAKHLRKFRPVRRNNRMYHKNIVAVEADGVEECQCIAVDARDGLYVTDDFIVTHNTSLVTGMALHAALDFEHVEEVTEAEARAAGELGFTSADGKFMLKRRGVPVAISSLEMSAESLGQKMLFQRARADLQRWRTGFATKDDFPPLIKATENICVVNNILIDDTARENIQSIKAKWRRWHRQYGVRFFMLDYIQLIKSSNKYRRPDRVQEMEEISAELQALGKELNCPMAILAQLNRDYEKEPNRLPRLSDLKNCGAIEQDADSVTILYKPSPYKPFSKEFTTDYDFFKDCMLEKFGTNWKKWDGRPERINALVEKNKHGPKGDAQLLFLKSSTLFVDYVGWLKENNFKKPAAGEESRYNKDKDEN